MSRRDPFADDRGYRLSPSARNGSDGSASSRWSFLNSPSPDLTLSLEGSPVEGADASFSYIADDLEDDASEEVRSELGHDDRGAVHEAVEVHRVQSIGLLVPGESLYRSTSTAPDSLIDPHMPRPNTLNSSATWTTPPPSSPSSAPDRTIHSTGDCHTGISPSRYDLDGRRLPSAPPPLDPYAQALAQGAVPPHRSARHRLSMLARPFHRPHEDDTQTSFNSIATSTSGYWDTSLSFNVPLPSTMSQRDPRPPPRPGPSPVGGTTRSQTDPAVVPRLASAERSVRPLSEHIAIDLPAVPPHSYSLPRTAGSPLPPQPSPPRPTLASRRSGQQLAPLLPISSTPARLRLPEPSLAPHSPVSPASSNLPRISRSEDGFYRLPVTPTSISARRTQSEREVASDLAFPLPPGPDSAALLLEPSGSTHTWYPSYRASSSGVPTLSLPSSPPPTSPPPPVPDFVSVFLNPQEQPGSPFDDDDDHSSDSDEAPCAAAPTSYPPAAVHEPRNSHARAMPSVSSSIASPHRQNLRQRVVPVTVEEGAPSGSRETSDGSEDAKQRRMETWLRDLTPIRASSSVPDTPKAAAAKGYDAPSRVRWAEKVAPGWSLRSDPVRLGDERVGRGGARIRLAAALRSRKLRILAAVGIVAVLLLVVGLATGFARRAAVLASSVGCNCEHGGSIRPSSDGLCYCACSSGWGGTSCHLNATCVDTGGGPVAQGILDLSSSSSGLWQPALNTSRLGSTLGTYFASTSAAASSTCQSQLALLVVPTLPSATYPSRLRWTESALVHTLVLTESNTTLTQLRTFASGLSFAPFGDSPASKPNSNYQIIAGGWTWDLAALQRSATGSWSSVVGPSSDAVSRLDAAPVARDSLARLAPIAAASSAQRTKALTHYWVGVLGRTADELAAFRTAVQRAEIVVPLDATASVGGTSMMDLAQAQTGAASFPPAIGCWSGLSDEVVARVNAVEMDVFGLAAISRAQSLNSSRLERPLYGILNLLHLRVPFATSDRRSSLPQQSLVLFHDAVADRLTLHAGELLAAGALAPTPTSPSQPATPERFGLLSRLDHVILDYFIAIPISTATELVDYVLSAPASPPSASTYASLLDNSLPVIEVQLWGGLRYDDITSRARRSAGATFRSWAKSNTQFASFGRVEWASSAEAAGVAVDQGSASTAFEGVWAQAASATVKTGPQVWSALQRAGAVST